MIIMINKLSIWNRGDYRNIKKLTYLLDNNQEEDHEVHAYLDNHDHGLDDDPYPSAIIIFLYEKSYIAKKNDNVYEVSQKNIYCNKICTNSYYEMNK